MTAATSALRARAPGSTVIIARSSPHGSTSVCGVRAAPSSRRVTPSALELAAHVLAGKVAAERGHERGAQAEPRRRAGGDRAAARRPHEVAREALLAEPGQRVEPDDGQVEERRGGDDQVDGHARA